MKYDSSFFEDLEADLGINHMRLDKEWLHQPQLYIKYAMASAHFNKVAALAADEVKVLQANLEADAAEDPDGCLGRGVKASVERCKNYALTHPEMDKVRRKAAEAKYQADMALGAVFACNQRKDALEQLVRLQGMEWNSAPQARDGISREGETRVLQRAAVDAVKNRDGGLTRPSRRMS